MGHQPFPLEQDERLLGQWAVRYLPPCGASYPGHLWVTSCRLIFVAKVEPGQLQPVIVGPPDPTGVAYALDLNTDQVTYALARLCVSIRKSDIEIARPITRLISQGVSLTLHNNGSIHLFDCGVLPAFGLAQAINE